MGRRKTEVPTPAVETILRLHRQGMSLVAIKNSKELKATLERTGGATLGLNKIREVVSQKPPGDIGAHDPRPISALRIEELKLLVREVVRDEFYRLRSETGVFAERRQHFTHEKRALAHAWADLYERELNRIKSTYPHRKIRVMLDSGSTCFDTALELFATKGGKNLSADYNVTIVTNSVPAIARAIEYEEEHYKTDFPEVKPKTIALPGQPVARYAAVIDETTLKFFERRFVRPHAINSDRYHNIVITTGNFAAVHKGQLCIYARHKGHRELKRKMLSIAHSVFVILPFGKFLPERVARDLNSHVDIDSNDANSYKALRIPDTVEDLKVLTTGRHRRDLLHSHYKVIKDALKSLPWATMEELRDKHAPKAVVLVDSFSVSDVLRFTRLKNELKLELPHAWERTPAVKKHFRLKRRRQS